MYKTTLLYSVNLAFMQQVIKKLQWFEYLTVVFLEILNLLLCRVFAGHIYSYFCEGYIYITSPFYGSCDCSMIIINFLGHVIVM